MFQHAEMLNKCLMPLFGPGSALHGVIQAAPMKTVPQNTHAQWKGKRRKHALSPFSLSLLSTSLTSVGPFECCHPFACSSNS